MGMVSAVRAALREAHAVSPIAGVNKINASLGQWLAWAGDPNPGRRATATAAQNYIAVVERCASWHMASALTYVAWERKGTVAYSATDIVHVLIRAVVAAPSGALWGRLLFWDGPRLSHNAALLIASPVVEVLDGQQPPHGVAGVEVWQCRTGEQITVSGAQARGYRSTVARHVAGM
jgi:hypothetical protein